MADQKASGDEATLTGSEGGGTQRQGECLGLRWKASSSAVDDSGTESGEDLRLLSPELLRDVHTALSRLEGALPGLDSCRRGTVSQLVNRLQSCLKIPPPSVPPVPPPRRFPNKKSARNRHTVGVTKEELADARRWIAESDMQRQSSVGSLPYSKEESVVSKVFRPVKFSPPPPAVEKKPQVKPVYLQKMRLVRKVLYKPILHRAGYFMEPAPQMAAISYVEPYPDVKMERSSSDTGSLLDYDPSLNLFTPEQSVQIAVHKAAIKKQISREGVKRRESSEDGDVSSGDEDADPERRSDVSSAQRLLQLASENPKKSSTPSRFHSKTSKKIKIKRANTIDIPKPASYYDQSSDGEYGGGSADEGSNADYISPGRKFSAEKNAPPNFEPKTENDLKFLAFLQHANETSQSKVISYNPSARGGKHWSSRFSNIKNTFEGTERAQNAAPAAKLFWQNAQSEPSYTAVGAPQILQPKLPWSVKTEKDGVVVGSLTVAKRPPGPINQFTHAPKSAFKPVEKKSHGPASSPSTVKQIVTQKFSGDSPKPVLRQYLNGREKFYPKTVIGTDGTVPKHFSSSITSSHRQYPFPQSLTANQNQTDRSDNSRQPSKYPQNLTKKQPTVIKDDRLAQSTIAPHPLPTKVILYNHRPDTTDEPIKRSVRNDSTPSSCPVTKQSYTANISTTQKPYELERKPPQTKPNENSLIIHPPPESYLKIHPRYPRSPDLTYDRINQQPILQESAPETHSGYAVENNYHRPSERSILNSEEPLIIHEPVMYNGDTYVNDANITSSNGPTDRQNLTIGPNINGFDGELPERNHFNDSLLQKSPNTISPILHSSSLQYNDIPYVDEPNNNTPGCKVENPPNLYSNYSLLSPHNIPLAHNNIESISPVISYRNNVSPGQVPGCDRNINSISPIAVNCCKSPTLRYEEQESINASPNLWVKGSYGDVSDGSSPVACTEEKAAVSKVMGQAQCQKAVTVNNRTKRRYDLGKNDKIESELRLQIQQSARQKALSPSFPNVLQKSESWHQIVKEQMQQPKQPPPRPKLSKAKSSHSLAFPKQFEAALSPENVTHKQSTVSQYMMTTTSTISSASKVTAAKKPSVPKPKLKSQISEILSNDDLENVDEAFENIFQESNKKRNSK